MKQNNGRIVAIRATAIKKADGSDNPETITIRVNGADTRYEIDSQQAEVDFILGEYPTSYRVVTPDDDINVMIANGTLKDHHVKWDKVEEISDLPAEHVKTVNEDTAKKPDLVHYVAQVIPASYDGIKAGDTVAMSHGFGNMLARDIAEDGEQRGVQVYRIPTGSLKDARDIAGTEKEMDDVLLANLVQTQPELFHLIRPEDYGTSMLGVVYQGRQDAQKQRIRMSNRLVGRARNAYLKAKRAGKPLDSFELAFDEAKASDKLFQRFLKEEEELEKAFDDLLNACPLWPLIRATDKGKGIGAVTAAGVISEVGDIRRFMVKPDDLDAHRLKTLRRERDECLQLGDYQLGKETLGEELNRSNGYARMCQVAKLWQTTEGKADEAEMISTAIKLSAQIQKIERRYEMKSRNKFLWYAGVAYPTDGVFQRRRKTGPEDEPERANHSPTLRQRLYIMAGNFNRMPKCYWGQKLREFKAKFKIAHPDEVQVIYIVKKKVEVDGKMTTIDVTKTRTKYTKGHLQRMATWRTATRCAEWMFSMWYRYEMNLQKDSSKRAEAAA